MKKFLLLLLLFKSIAAFAQQNSAASIQISPKTYCVSDAKSTDCVAYIFGSIHHFYPDQSATTPDLMNAVSKTKSIYFELATYGQIQIKANLWASEREYLRERQDFFIKDRYPDNELPNRLIEAFSDFQKNNNLEKIAKIYQQISQERCGLTRFSGTEEYITRKIVGSDKTIYSLEIDRASKQVFSRPAIPPQADSQIEKQSNPSSKPHPTMPPEFDNFIKTTCKQILSDVQNWQQQSLAENDRRVFNAMDPRVVEATKQRNLKMIAVILEAIQAKKKPVVILGYTHLYGESGLLDLFSKNGFKLLEYTSQ